MAEEEVAKEATDVATEAAVEEVTEVIETPEPDPVESQARGQGWVSKEEWVANGKAAGDWRDAGIFLERGEFMRKVSNLHKRATKAEEGLKTLTEHHQRVAEYERNKVLKELKEAKVQAFKDDNFERVAELDEEIAKVRDLPAPELQAADTKTADNSEQQAEVSAWVEKNPWFTSDPELRKQALILMAGKRAVDPNITPQQIFDSTTAEIRRSNPNKFRPKEATPKVGTTGRTTAPKKGGEKSYPSLNDLPYEVQKVVRTWTDANPSIKPDRYIKELVDTGGIEWNR